MVWCREGRRKDPETWPQETQILRALTIVVKEAGENSDTTRLIGIPPVIRFVTEPCPGSSIREKLVSPEQTELCCRGDLVTT